MRSIPGQSTHESAGVLSSTDSIASRGTVQREKKKDIFIILNF